MILIVYLNFLESKFYPEPKILLAKAVNSINLFIIKIIIYKKNYNLIYKKNDEFLRPQSSVENPLIEILIALP